ncbi:hypothetical protein WJX84_010242 [Apatococcus fuscideae]|uniref:Uncharacterized protein n=1 Tax=Apatococcus fuscideae TaxID=2026836 RepID=A0AAW1SZH0_9CHLO
MHCEFQDNARKQPVLGSLVSGDFHLWSVSPETQTSLVTGEEFPCGNVQTHVQRLNVQSEDPPSSCSYLLGRCWGDSIHYLGYPQDHITQ